MKDNFSACLEFTLKYEGGWSNDPMDPGGATMKGVTQRVYDAYRRKHGKPHLTVRAINSTELNDIYRHEYWDEVHGDDLPAGVDLVVFDYAVNSGPGRAEKVYHDHKDLTPQRTVENICDARLRFLEGLRTWDHFGKGWGARVAACERLAIHMAGG